MELRIPKLPKGSYFPGFLEPRRLAEKALAAWCRAASKQWRQVADQLRADIRTCCVGDVTFRCLGPRASKNGTT